jgi:hypothetical protein
MAVTVASPPCLGAPLSPPAATQAPNAGSIKEMRRQAAEQRRRIIFNSDGGDVVRGMTEPTVENLLKQRTNTLADTQVDSLFYTTKATGLDLFTHHTKIGTLFTTRDAGYDNNQTGQLFEKGIDPLKVMVNFAKQNNMEVFWSLRMNDTHDGGDNEYGPANLAANRLKMAHPEFMLGTAKKRPKHGAWTALDYGRPEVRERAFRLLEEVCRNYDIDGIELDYFRHVVFFRSTARGELATDKERAAMTAMMVRVRKMADEIGQKRGRPILIAVRVPDSVEYCRAVGLDLERWLANDLVDLLVLSSYFQLNEWDYSVALGHKYGVKVYPSLDESRLQDKSASARRMTNLAYRARAADVWRSGADGVYIFNYPFDGDPNVKLMSELGSAESLAQLDKDYFGSIRGVRGAKSSRGYLPYQPYLKVETLSSDNPKTIKPGATATAKITLGEKLDRLSNASLKLRLDLGDAKAAEDFRVAINGNNLNVKRTADDWFECEPAVSDLRLGLNSVEVALTDKAKRPAVWSDLMLQVRHTKK